MEESCRRKWKVVRKWNVIVWKGILFLFFLSFFSTMLTACLFVTRDTVRHLRRFVFGKFVRKPNCSWSEAFVSRGLTVRRGKQLFFLTIFRLRSLIVTKMGLQFLPFWKCILYADDQILMATSEDDLQTVAHHLNLIARKYKMTISSTKTKCGGTAYRG